MSLGEAYSAWLSRKLAEGPVGTKKVRAARHRDQYVALRSDLEDMHRDFEYVGRWADRQIARAIDRLALIREI